MSSDLVLRFVGIDLVSRVAERAGNSIDRMESRIRRSGMASSQALVTTGVAMTAFGIGMIAGAAGITAAVGFAIEKYAQFQSDILMSVNHANLARDAIGQVGTALKEMAIQVGFGPDQLAQAFYHVQSASTSLGTSLQNVTSELDITRNAAMLAAIGHANLTDTTNALISVLTSYKDTNLSASDAAAMLNKIVGEGNMTMQQLASALANGLLPVAAQAGVSLQSVGAALGTLTDLGVSSSRASTYIRSAIIQMTMPTGPAAKALEALGLSGQAAMEQIGAFSQILDDAGINQSVIAAELRKSGSIGDTLNNFLIPALKRAGVSSGEATSLIERAFGGIRSGTGVIGLTNNLQGLMQKEHDAADATKKWADTWDYFRKNDPQFVINQLGAAFQDLVVTIGGVLFPLMRSLRDVLLPVVESVTKWADANGQLLRTIIPIAIAVLGIGGALMTLGGFILIAAGSFGVLVSAAVPVVAAIGGVIAAVASAIGSLVAVTASGAAIVGWPIALAGAFITLLPVLLTVGAVILAGVLIFQHWSQIVHGAVGFVTEFVTAMQRGSTVGGALFSALAKIGVPLQTAAIIGSTLNSLLGFMTALVQRGVSAARGLITEFMRYLQQDPMMQDALKQLAIAWQDLQPFIMGAGVVLGAVGGIILVLLGGAFQGLMMALKYLIPGAIMVFAGAIQFITGVVSFFADLFTGKFDKLGRDVTQIWEGLGHVLEGLFIGVVDTVVGFVIGFVNGVVGAFKNLYDILVGHSIIPDLINEIEDLFRSLPARLLSQAGQWIDAGKQLAMGLAQGIQQAAGNIISAATGVVSSAVDAAKNLLGIHSPSIVMAQQVGLPMAQGMAQGLALGQPMVTAAVVQLGTIAIPAAAATAASISTTNNTTTVADHGLLVVEVRHVLDEMRALRSELSGKLDTLTRAEYDGANQVAHAVEGGGANFQKGLAFALNGR